MTAPDSPKLRAERSRIPSEDAAVRYRDGATLRALGAFYGTSKEAVRQVLLSAGVAMRQRGGNMGPHSRHRKR